MPNAPLTSSPKATRPSFSEGVAQNVIDACRKQDPDARITYVGRDENERTRVRVRAGQGASVQSLQRALTRLMPYAKVRTSEDVLDGNVVAEIVIPTSATSTTWHCARRASIQRRGLRTRRVSRLR